MRIALLCNCTAGQPSPCRQPVPDDALEEYDSPETIAAITRALRAAGAEVEAIEADRTFPQRLTEGRYDIVFNIAEGRGRRCREAIPAAVCELIGLPHTGSDAVTLGVTLDKWLARRIVSPDVRVAPAVLVDDEDCESRIGTLQFPVIVKPNDEGSSIGIRDNPIATGLAEARERCRWLRTHYGCPVLVEEFLPGMEITVGIVGNGRSARVLGMLEIAGAPPFVYSLEVKRDFRRLVRYHVPPRLTASAQAALAEHALAAYRLLGCRDVARLDFRMDRRGEPNFLECNPLPGLNPESGDLAILSRDILPYEHLVRGILRDAALRYGMSCP